MLRIKTTMKGCDEVFKPPMCGFRALQLHTFMSRCRPSVIPVACSNWQKERWLRVFRTGLTPKDSRRGFVLSKGLGRRGTDNCRGRRKTKSSIQ